MQLKSIFLAMLLALSFGFLAGCESSEERAEKHFQSAIALLEKGDEERAIVEFRNVFKLNIRHKEARAAYADLQRTRGNFREAIGQYLRLVEQYPDHVVGHRAIAEMYAEIGNWQEMERFLVAAQALDSGDSVTKALQLVFDYRQAVENENSEIRKETLTRAADMVAELPEYILLRQVVIDGHVRNANYEAALAELDVAIQTDPDNRRLYGVRLSVLAALEDSFGIEIQLKDMISRFPDDETSRSTLVRWYVSQGQLDDAETYLREVADSENAESDDQLTLLRFLAELRGQDAALAELNRIIESGDASPLLHGLRAGYEFDLGDRDLAVAQLQELLTGLEPSDESRKIKIALSQMMVVTGNSVGARALIEEVLVEDKSNVDALKLKANWLIEDDLVGDAIVALRTALDQAPRDANILTMLARAHERDGNQDLVGEMLSLALAISNSAPDESIRYAKFLIELEKFDTAEGILVDSLRLAPSNLGVLTELGNIYVLSKDWPRADQVLATLRRVQSDDWALVANDLNAKILQGQHRTTEAIEFLEGLVQSGAAGFGAKIAIVRTHMSADNPDKAKEYVEVLLKTEPGNLELLFLEAAIYAGTGNTDVAEVKYRSLLEREPGQVQVWVALFRLLSATGQPEAAEQAIDTARAQSPDDLTLRWIKAGILEQSGDLEGAISIYEEMYVQDNDNLIIANNLASLLSTVRDDIESIERANTIARRLRPSKIPPYQDTFGWIAYLRGDFEEAIRALEPAAAGLASDPTVQFHLAQAYLAGNRPKDALDQFLKVVELTGAADTREFVLTSRQESNRLRSELSGGEND